MISFFLFPKKLSDKPNPFVRTTWNDRKVRLRFAFAVLTTLLIIIGCELSSPNYSITTHFVEDILAKSETLNGIFTQGWAKKFFIANFDKESNLPIYQGSTVKFTIFFLLFFLFSLHYLSNDPLSDSALLRALSRTDVDNHPPYLFRFLPEINFYAKHCPSNTLPLRCAKCVTLTCANRLAPESESKTYHWNRMVATLPSPIINHLLFTTNKCRFLLFLRYSLWASSAVLVLVYILARIFEHYIRLETSANFELIGYIFLLWVVGLILGRLNSATDFRSSGVWGQFKESVSQLSLTDEYKSSFESSVCRHNNFGFCYTTHGTPDAALMHQRTSGSELQTLMTVIQFLDHVLQKKLNAALERNGTPSDKDSLRNILIALVKMFSILNSDTCRFRAVVLVPDTNGRFLEPLVTVPFPDQPFLTYDHVSDYEEKLSKTSGSVASIAWRDREIVARSGNEIVFFHDAQFKYLKSIIAVPLIVENEVQNQFRNRDLMLDSVIGVVCLDSDNETILGPRVVSLNQVLIKPFTNLLMFEMLFAASKRAH